MICVLAAYCGQENGEADQNPKVLGVFPPPPKKKKNANAFAGNKKNQYIVGELSLKMGKKSS